MKEHSDKASCLNFSFVSRGKEKFFRSTNLAAVKKDADNVWEAIKASFMLPDDSWASKEHAEPELSLVQVAGISLDNPNVNLKVLKLLDASGWPVAGVPCGFHAWDGVIHKLVQLPAFKKASSSARALTRFSCNHSRVRCGWKAVQKRVIAHLANQGTKVIFPVNLHLKTVQKVFNTLCFMFGWTRVY